MAEQVQGRMENMTREFEELIRIGLFSCDETRTIMSTRKKHEFDLTNATVTLDHYKDYIKHEMNMLRTIKLRRSKYNITESRGIVEHKILQRVKSLYEFGMQRFPENIQFCLAYFQFCKQTKYNTAAQSIVNTLLEKHASKPKVWQICAKWYACDRKDINLALKTLDKGRELHKDCDFLYKESIQLEILEFVGHQNGKQEKSDEEDERKKDICIERLRLYLEHMFDNIKSYDFYIDLLGFLEQYKFTIPIQKDIVDFMMNSFSDVPIVWHTLAQREQKKTYSEGNKNVTTKTRLASCFSKYEEGLKHEKLSEEGRKELWMLYIGYLIELQLEDFGVAKIFKTKQLLKALKEGFEAKVLMEKHYTLWAELSDSKEAGIILQHGTNALPESVGIWKQRLQHYIIQLTKDSTKELEIEFENVFNKGVSCLKQNSLPLWTTMIRYKSLCKSVEEAEEVYRRGVDQPKEISSHVKSKYIEWLAVTKGMDYTRKVYDELAFKQPYCKEFHVTMAQLEETEVEYDFDSWEKVHKNACEQFGNKDEEVWLNYVSFFLHNKKEDDLEKIAMLCNKAKMYLDKERYFRFLERYQVLTANCK